MQASNEQVESANVARSAFDATIQSQGSEEYIRLRKQHALIRFAMGEELVRVPLPKNGPARILDSATGDGTWMVDVAAQFPMASMIGADVDAKHFEQLPQEVLPSRIKFKTQSVFDPWPPEDQEAYDLVHQRLLLAIFSPDKSKAAVEGLFSLVKPGGYIQLVESDLLSFDREGHPGMTMFMDFAEKAFPMANMNHIAGRFLKEWLEGAGAIDIEQKQFTYGMGAQAETQEMKNATTKHIMTMISNLEMITSRKCFQGCPFTLLNAKLGIPNYWYTPENFKKLKDAVLREMQQQGNTWRYWLATGRKTPKEHRSSHVMD